MLRLLLEAQSLRLFLYLLQQPVPGLLHLCRSIRAALSWPSRMPAQPPVPNCAASLSLRRTPIRWQPVSWSHHSTPALLHWRVIRVLTSPSPAMSTVDSVPARCPSPAPRRALSFHERRLLPHNEGLRYPSVHTSCMRQSEGGRGEPEPHHLVLLAMQEIQGSDRMPCTKGKQKLQACAAHFVPSDGEQVHFQGLPVDPHFPHGPDWHRCGGQWPGPSASAQAPERAGRSPPRCLRKHCPTQGAPAERRFHI